MNMIEVMCVIDCEDAPEHYELLNCCYGNVLGVGLIHSHGYLCLTFRFGP